VKAIIKSKNKKHNKKKHRKRKHRFFSGSDFISALIEFIIEAIFNLFD